MQYGGCSQPLMLVLTQSDAANLKKATIKNRIPVDPTSIVGSLVGVGDCVSGVSEDVKSQCALLG